MPRKECVFNHVFLFEALEPFSLDLTLFLEISCPFHEVGCQEAIKRKDMDNHMRDETHSHLILTIICMFFSVFNLPISSENGK